jgi:hypothetical protein
MGRCPKDRRGLKAGPEGAASVSKLPVIVQYKKALKSKNNSNAFFYQIILPLEKCYSSVGGTSRLFGSQILVFHFPSVIQGVKGGVPNKVSERPFRYLTSQLVL